MKNKFFKRGVLPFCAKSEAQIRHSRTGQNIPVTAKGMVITMKKTAIRLLNAGLVMLLCVSILCTTACHSSSSSLTDSNTLSENSDIVKNTEEVVPTTTISEEALSTTTLPSIATTTTVGNNTPTTNQPVVPKDLGNGTTYYVSSSSGNNANNGTSMKTPFKTVDAINALSLNAGDNVLFKRGDTFIGAHLSPTGIGEAKDGKWITLDAYGSGANPVFKNAAMTKPAISMENISAGKGYRIRHIDIDGYLQGIGVVKTSMDMAFDGLVISDCTIQNITLNRMHSGGDSSILPGGAALAFGMWLVNVKNVTVSNVTIQNIDCPVQMIGGNAVFDNLDIFNVHMQGMMLYGAVGDLNYNTVISTLGNVTVKNSRIRYVGYQVGPWGSTGILMENLHNCTVKNVEIAYVVNGLAAYDACALDWEQSNINCTIDSVYAHDNHGPMLLAMEHEGSAGNSRGNVVKNSVSVNNGLHGTAEVGTFLNLSSYNNSNQKITIENCFDIGRSGSSPVTDSNKFMETINSTSKVSAKNFVSGTIDVYADFGTTSLDSFISASGASVSNAQLALTKGGSVRTKFSGSGYAVASFLKGDAQLTFLSRDTNNGYVWKFGKNRILAQKKVSGKLTTLKTITVKGLNPTSWFRVRVETGNGKIKTYVDDKLVDTLADNVFTTGAVGLLADGNGTADQFMVWRLQGSNRKADSYEVNNILRFGEFKVAGDWHSAETSWLPSSISDWTSRPFEAGWGTVKGSGATLTRKSVNVSVSGYNKVQLILMNGTNSGKVWLEFTKDGGRTWHGKSIYTAYKGSDSYWGLNIRTFQKYTVDMSNILQWSGKINGLRIRFDGNSGVVGVKTVTIYN
ncbi:MAG: hypothetical protein PHR14_01025 [Oscillospiraceae bacterium]|nr:hypothetical protein [Oscillospiraceae bacterium]